jgi:hypothetical protein
MKLTQDQEEELRGFFGGALEVAVGCRSPLGSMLDRMKYKLPPDGIVGLRRNYYADDDRGAVVGWQPVIVNDAEDRLIDAAMLVARQRIIRRALHTLSRAQVDVLRTAFSPIPEQLVLGLVSTFGDRETAAVVLLSVSVDAPGASRREKLRALIERANGDKRKKVGPSEKAVAEITDRRLAAKLAIGEAIDRYLIALRDAQRAAREAKRRGSKC